MYNPYTEQIKKNTLLAYYYIHKAVEKNPNTEITVKEDAVYINGKMFSYIVDGNKILDYCFNNKVNHSYVEERVLTK